MKENHSDIINRLKKSKFRNSFSLKQKDFDYINRVGMDTIGRHCFDFVTKRLKDPSQFTDGKQTPFKGHPVFIAQHATATCCRGCLCKWHKIEKTHILSEKEIAYICSIIMYWINKKIQEHENNQ